MLRAAQDFVGLRLELLDRRNREREREREREGAALAIAAAGVRVIGAAIALFSGLLVPSLIAKRSHAPTPTGKVAPR
jgi:hypothetical protein